MAAPSKGVAAQDPLPPQQEAVDERGNGYGMCMSCKKFRRVWSHICSFCGECCE